jgi:hypothetical protein
MAIVLVKYPGETIANRTTDSDPFVHRLSVGGKCRHTPFEPVELVVWLFRYKALFFLLYEPVRRFQPRQGVC